MLKPGMCWNWNSRGVMQFEIGEIYGQSRFMKLVYDTQTSNPERGPGEIVCGWQLVDLGSRLW